MATYTEEEYRKALEILQETLPYKLQRRLKNGAWMSIGKSIRGRAAANKALNYAKTYRHQPDQDAEFRVLPQNEADKYAEGFAAGRACDESREERHRSRVRRPLVHLPEHL